LDYKITLNIFKIDYII